MAKKTPALELTDDQVRLFRARRSHTIGPGADDVAAAAHDLLGAQAQIETCALHALSLRTQGRPTASQVQHAIVSDERRLVRIWGQRDTLHLYAATDWPDVIGAIDLWVRSGRRGGLPTNELLETAAQTFESAGRPLTRTDLFEIIPDDYVEELEDHPGAAGKPRRLAATRLIWCLAKAGVIAHATKDGSEQSYAARSLWFPGLDGFPSADHSDDDMQAAATRLCRRYLGTWGPASARDVAHHFGSRVTDARVWLNRLEGELVRVDNGGRKGLVALADDVNDLRADPADYGADAWPVRLLPGYETALMTHKDKSWIAASRDHEKAVWRRAAVVKATVIDRGRIVGIWNSKLLTRDVRVTVTPLPGWEPGCLPQVESEVAEYTAHVERERFEVTVE